MELSTATTTTRSRGLEGTGAAPVRTAPASTPRVAATSPRTAPLERRAVEDRRMVVDGVAFVHQRFHGSRPQAPPAALLQHFPNGTDEWDPVAPLQRPRAREIILMEHLDRPPDAGIHDRELGPLARECLDFIGVLELAEVDLLGFSLEVRPPDAVVLLSPRLVQRLVAASLESRSARGGGSIVMDITDVDDTREEHHT